MVRKRVGFAGSSLCFALLLLFSNCYVGHGTYLEGAAPTISSHPNKVATSAGGHSSKAVVARKVFTFVLAGVSAAMLGLFTWRATQHGQYVTCDASPYVGGCVQNTQNSMIGTGLPAFLLPGVAAAVWPYGSSSTPAHSTSLVSPQEHRGPL